MSILSHTKISLKAKKKIISCCFVVYENSIPWHSLRDHSSNKIGIHTYILVSNCVD